MPTWDNRCRTQYKEFLAADFGLDSELKGHEFNACLDTKRNLRWEETTHNIDFTLSSRQAWSTFNRLTGRTFSA